MENSLDQISIESILKRASHKNYFTPLEPKHSLKPRIQRYSKIFLKYPIETISISQSPVSIRNYKDSSAISSIISLPKLYPERKNSQPNRHDFPFPLDSPRSFTIKRQLPPIEKINEAVHSSLGNVEIKNNETSPKNHLSAFDNYNQKKVQIGKKIIKPVLSEEKNTILPKGVIIKKKYEKPQGFISQIKKNVAKKESEVVLVSHGENTDDNSIIGWEEDYSRFSFLM